LDKGFRRVELDTQHAANHVQRLEVAESKPLGLRINRFHSFPWRLAESEYLPDVLNGIGGAVQRFDKLDTVHASACPGEETGDDIDETRLKSRAQEGCTAVARRLLQRGTLARVIGTGQEVSSGHHVD